MGALWQIIDWLIDWLIAVWAHFCCRCSRESMLRVIADERHSECLMARPTSFCGNGIVEQGEECDCGTTYSCQIHDSCCTPLTTVSPSPGRPPCRLRSDCSPRVHRCCTDACTIAAAGVTCRQKTECSAASVCDGRSRTCPAPQPANDGKSCAAGQGNCRHASISYNPSVSLARGVVYGRRPSHNRV